MAVPERSLRPAREDSIVQLQLILKRAGARGKGKQAGKGAAAGQAAHCRGQLQVYLKSLCLRMQGQQPSMQP